MQARLGVDHVMGAELSCTAKRGGRGGRIRINTKALTGGVCGDIQQDRAFKAMDVRD
jgi:hypothetical protein